MFATEEDGYCGKLFADEWRESIIEYVSWDAVRDDTMIKKDTCNMCGCCFGLWNSSSQLGALIVNDKCVLVSLRCLGKWSQDIHGAKSSGLDAEKS